MTDLGDISKATSLRKPFYAMSITPAIWPNVSKATSLTKPWHAFSYWTATKAPTSVTIDVPDATPNDILILLALKGGALVDRARVDDTGHAYFYDLDDGDYRAVSIAIEALAWDINVTGTDVTVTLVTSGGGGGGTRSFVFLS